MKFLSLTIKYIKRNLLLVCVSVVITYLTFKMMQRRDISPSILDNVVTTAVAEERIELRKEGEIELANSEFKEIPELRKLKSALANSPPEFVEIEN